MMIRLRKATALICAIASIATNVAAAGAFELKMPTKLATPHRLEPLAYTPDILLVMPNKGLKNDELEETMEEVHGTVVGSLGEGDLKCYIVKTEKGHLEETEKKLTKDKKHFSIIGRNYRIPACKVPDSTAVDPQFKDQWHLDALHCPAAWDHATGKGVRIAVFDTGCANDNRDLNGKTIKGYDAHTVVSKILGLVKLVLGPTPGVDAVIGLIAGLVGERADFDTKGHGTMVATTAAGRMSNGFAGVGVAPDARIYPVRIAEQDNPTDKKHQYTTDLDIIAGLLNVMGQGIRIVNISYNVPVVGFHNPKYHAALHQYFLEYYTVHQGLIFISSGNESFPDPTPPVPYINLVSAIGQDGKLADFSNYGTAVTFTAPGEKIGCSDNILTGNAQTPNGTSFSCPIVAGIAALILEDKPLAPAIEIQRTLIRSCKKIKGIPFTSYYYGWGMPDAYTAVTGNEYRPPATDGVSHSPPSFNVAAGHSDRRVAGGGGGVAPGRP